MGDRRDGRRVSRQAVSVSNRREGKLVFFDLDLGATTRTRELAIGFCFVGIR